MPRDNRRSPDGFKTSGAGAGGGAPDISVAGYAGYDPDSSPPLSEGLRVLTNAPADPSGDFILQLSGFGFEDGDALDLQPIGGPPPPAVPATLNGAATYFDPAGTVPGTISTGISDYSSADAVGVYMLTVTNAAGLIGAVMVEIAVPPV